MKSLSLWNNYKKMPKVAKATLWFTICNFAVAGLGFITGPLFTRLLPPEEYGILTLYVTYEHIFLIIATWEIQLGAYQRGLFKYENNWGQYSLSTLLLVNLMTICTFVVVFIFYGPIFSFTKMSSLTLMLVFVCLILQPAYVCWMIRKRTAYEYQTVVGMTLLFSISNVIFPLVAVLHFGGTASIKFNVTLITSALLFSVFYFKTIFNKNAHFSLRTFIPQWRYMLAYEAPLVLHSLSYLVLGQADRVMIGKMVGAKEAAFYGVAYTLASAVTILQRSLNQALTPWRYHKLKDCNFGIIDKITNILLLLIGAAILAIVLIAPELMKILFPQDYYEAVWCIPPVSISIFFMFLYSTFVSIESYYERTKYVMYVSLTCGLINVVLNYLFIPIVGYIVCGYTTLVSYILFAVFHYICMQMVCRKAISGSKIFSIRKICAISVGVILCSILLTILFPYWIARYALLFVMIRFALKYKNEIKNCFAIMKSK